MTRAPIIPTLTLAFGMACLWVAALSAPGCQPKPTDKSTPSLNITGESIARASVRREVAADEIDRAKPDTKPRGREHLDAATGHLDKQADDLTQAAAALATERERHGKIEGDLSVQLEAERTQRAIEAGKWYAVAGRNIDAAIGWVVGWFRRLLKWSWLILLVSVLVRSLGLAIPGDFGKWMAWLANIGFAVLSGGVSLITTIFDNLWFRKLSPTAARKAATQ